MNTRSVACRSRSRSASAYHKLTPHTKKAKTMIENMYIGTTKYKLRMDALARSSQHEEGESEDNDDSNTGNIHMPNRREKKVEMKMKEDIQVVEEIKNFKDDVLACFDHQNTLLERIAISLEKMHTSKINLPPFQSKNDDNIPISPISQGEFVEHEVEDFEAVREPYPYENFTTNELDALQSSSKTYYDQMLKLAKGNEALAYYFYENRNITNDTKKSFIPIYEDYFSKQSTFDLTKLKAHYAEKDFCVKGNNKATLRKKWKQWRLLAITSYGIKPADFPKLRFFNKQKGREEDHAAFSKEVVQDITTKLHDNGKVADALLVHIMYSCALRPGEVRFLRFEDVKQSNTQTTINIYRSKRDRHQCFAVSKELYEEIQKYKTLLISIDKYNSAIRTTSRGEDLEGHFMFNTSRFALNKKFSSGFGGLLKNLKIRPKDLRISSISDKNTFGNLTEAAQFADHKRSNITREHYARAAISFRARK